MATRARTLGELKAELEMRSRATEATNLVANEAETKLRASERQLAEAREKIAELEIVRDALIALVRKMKSVIAPGEWAAILPFVAATGILGAPVTMILGKST